MSRFILFNVAAGVMLTASALADPPKLEFQTVTSKAGQFTVSMPGKPKETTQEPDTAAGKLRSGRYTVEISKDLAYLISYKDYPATAVTDEPQTILKRVRDGNAAGVGGKVLKDKEITLGMDKVPGRDIVIEKPDLHYRARIFLAGKRLYQVIVVGSRAAVTAKDADQYLDSFKITALALADPPKLKFQTVTSKEGRFTVSMPGKPKETTQEADNPGGKVRIRVFTVELSKDLAYMIMYNDFSVPALAAGPQTILKAGRDGGVSSLQGKLLQDKEISLGDDKVPGRDILIGSPTVHFRARIFLADKRLYQVIVVGSRAAVTAKDADQYLNSFKITK